MVYTFVAPGKGLLEWGLGSNGQGVDGILCLFLRWAQWAEIFLPRQKSEEGPEPVMGMTRQFRTLCCHQMTCWWWGG